MEADLRFTRRRFEGRAQYAHGFVDGAAALNDAVGRLTGISPNVARQIRGFYLEGAYRVLPQGFPHDAAVFVRYENFDTQYRMDEGNLPLPAFDRDAWVVGGTYWLDPDVALKVDYSHVRSQSTVVPAPRTFNVGNRMVVLMTSNTRVLAGVGVLAALLVAPAVARQAGGPSQQPAGGTQEKPRKTIDIVAERFLFTPAEITVDRGTTLEIRLTSEDTDHGFRILDTDINVTIPKRGRGHVAVVFDAKDAGDYTFECSHVCGAGHSFMRGRIRVKAPGDAAGQGATGEGDKK